MSENQDSQLYATLVSLADTVISDFDVVDVADLLVHSCLDLIDVDSVGIMVDDQRGALRVLASTNEEAQMLELLELQSDGGPCLEAFNTGLTVVIDEIAREAERWPDFTREALALNLSAATALPMRLRDRTIGALNLFSRNGGLSQDDLRIAEVLTSMATIGILTHRALRRQEVLAEQLQTALNSRIVIEQAKGVIAERAKVDMATAFNMLRSAARGSRRPLSEVAADVARGRLDASPRVSADTIANSGAKSVPER